MNKKKLFNDPVYGFVSIAYETVFDLIEHPYFQRLRNIKQLGLTHLVYPGALHTRFHHALGAMHLMGIALETLKNKGVIITEEEAEGVTIAILLHDIGHGPFSHALESCIVPGVQHEALSVLIMHRLNKYFNGKLTLAIAIFENKYEKKFLHQLVSSQLDMDRLDYLNRDSFYTGVSEGVIGFDRILKMLQVVNDELVVEEKGIYSIEKFLISRRLMYWQVYLHKTVIAAEQLLVKIFQRAKAIANNGVPLFASPSFNLLLANKISTDAFCENELYLDAFMKLDDSDLFSAIKVWSEHEDPILAKLCKLLIDRKLFTIEMQNEAFTQKSIQVHKDKLTVSFPLTAQEQDYFVFSGKITNNAYNMEVGKINILTKSKGLIDIADASDNLNLSALSKTVEKYFICYPK
ncbi:MAG: HD domain-containing protein [Sphingobacteriaceae bacterium]